MEHAEGTASLAALFAAWWGAGDWGRLLGLWHDLGKFAPEFQAMIAAADPKTPQEGGARKPDHSSAGGQWAIRHYGPLLGSLFAYAIAGHHAGLGDWEDEGRPLRHRLAETSHLDRALRATPPHHLLEQAPPRHGIPDGADYSLWVRMLASALFDADFLDTEAFFNPDKTEGRDGWPRLEDLTDRLESRLGKFKTVNPSPVNALRAEVLAACRVAAEKPPGLYSLTVPTGGGKTLSSLAFALRHAKRHGLCRVIYAVPFTSVVEQTARVFRDALGRDAVLEHHSFLEAPKEEDEGFRWRLASENWDAPLVVTTTVQLFESFFASRTSRLRKLHNVAGSVLVLDEAQALPPGILKPVTALLDQLVRHYKVTVVLCTATQPALGAVFKELPQPTEIAPEPNHLFKALERIRTEWPTDGTRLSWEDLAAEMSELPQALAIVNSRADCRTLHGLLPECAIHLSTRQCAAHRLALLKVIRNRLRRGEPCRVVSTTLVEAGVDLDFPAVFRALAGLDSLAQAAGRCNREGELPDKGRFVVFRPDAKPPHTFAQAIEAAEAALRDHGAAPFRPAAFKTFFNELYWSQATHDRYDMAGKLGLGADKPRMTPGGFDFRFRSAAEAFRMIDDDQQPVIVPHRPKVGRLVETLRHAGPSGALLRTLQRYTVPVRPWEMTALRDANAIEDVQGLAVLVREELYRKDVGLDVESITHGMIL
jgi:CRISPR-associated endonuclease/helicase Cas3